MTTAAEPPVGVSGSFRDPGGHVFTRDGRILRQVNRVYAEDYDHLLASGLYRALADAELLVRHETVAGPSSDGHDPYLVLAPERIPFISYPFEWGFGQLKAAALATLRVQRIAIEHGMTLKDASAYNVQFRGVSPVLIDTLSFERWQDGTPWVAYRQFCQHFLAPLALMSATDARLGALSGMFIDGPPLDLVSRLLPLSAKLHPSLLVHLHLHGRAQVRRGGGALDRSPAGFSRRSMLGLVDHLQSAVRRLPYRPARGVWSDYYDHTNYSSAAMADKHHIVSRMLAREQPRTVWDLGANSGVFSRLAAGQGAYTVAFDGDSDAVEQHHAACVARGEARVLPLRMDLANPSARLGWAHSERLSLVDRGPADMVLALGLVHHLSLSNQVPFAMVAAFLRDVGRTLVVEFVGRSDSQVAGMLSRMPGLSDRYAVEPFEHEFARYFTIDEVTPIADSDRHLYFMRRRESP